MICRTVSRKASIQFRVRLLVCEELKPFLGSLPNSDIGLVLLKKQSRKKGTAEATATSIQLDWFSILLIGTSSVVVALVFIPQPSDCCFRLANIVFQHYCS